MINLTKKKLQTTLEEAENSLLNGDRFGFTFDRKWSSNFPDVSGLYAIFDNGTLIYIGESANVKERMKELKRTINHTFRRKLCFKLFGKHPIVKSKYPEEIETALNDFYLSNISVSAIEMNFGRLETETYLINKYKDHSILNSIGKR